MVFDDTFNNISVIT